MSYLIPLTDINLSHHALVGGKNASLGEMLQNLSNLHIAVPSGFAITTELYHAFMQENKIDILIQYELSRVKASHYKAIKTVSQKIQKKILTSRFNAAFLQELTSAYKKLGSPVVAVRSSSIDEDTTHISAAGMQETYLNISGIRAIVKACQLVFASLFSARALSYRLHQALNMDKIAISIGIQPMVRSDKGVSGVMFTLDTESGFDKVVLISAAYGLGEGIVKGEINPDEFFLYKPNIASKIPALLEKRLGSKLSKVIYNRSPNPARATKSVAVSPKERTRFCLTEQEAEELARQGMLLEAHYGRPMDIEWAKDGVSGKFYILQARPETVNDKKTHKNVLEKYTLSKKSTVLTTGQSIGQRIGQGTVKVIHHPDKMDLVKPGDVLVTEMTDPDWEPIMKKAAAIVTNRGGRTCHAAIVARELGIPAVVGCGNATKKITAGKKVTVSCAEGQIGYVYDGLLPVKLEKIAVNKMPKLPLKLCLNLGNPEKAFTFQSLPNDGVGLARIEFIINEMIGLHPNAALQYPKLPQAVKKQIATRMQGYANPVDFYIDKLSQGIAMLAAGFYPKEVILRFSDFKSNEYANLIGGKLYEPHEENPMLGFRGASRYYDPFFRESFKLECKAIKKVREQMRLDNVHLMIPFVRTVDELKRVLATMSECGLKRGVNGLKVIMMCEIPSNVILAEAFLAHVDGFSIGSNDLTQLTLGLDRDSSMVAKLFDERNDAVKQLMATAIAVCRKHNKYIGICGQAPSDYPELAVWLMEQGISALSLNPDTIVHTWLRFGKLHETCE